MQSLYAIEHRSAEQRVAKIIALQNRWKEGQTHWVSWRTGPDGGEEVLRAETWSGEWRLLNDLGAGGIGEVARACIPH